MIRGALVIVGTIEIALGLAALAGIRSDIQIIVAQCGVGFGLAHVALGILVGRRAPVAPQTESR